MLASMGCHSLLSFAELLLQTSSQEILKGLVSLASSELPVGSSDVRGFVGNVENLEMIRLPFASESLKNRVGMRLEAGGWRTIQWGGKRSCGILGWVQIRLMMAGLSCENRNFLWWIMLIAYTIGRPWICSMSREKAVH